MKTEFTNVQLFFDINLTDNIGNELFKYNLEIIGHKARVIADSPFISDKDNTSRFNKLTSLGSWVGGETPDLYEYGLTVNGKRVYFRIEHNIYD